MPELDVLRGLAILMVVFYHGLYQSGATTSIPLINHFIHATIAGWLGVNLFFVLSGFLITGILLDTKGKPGYYRQFYLRRVLRILPPYFAVLLILFLTGLMHVPQTIVAVLFLANYMYLMNIPGGYGPLWSLSVEEQFYLLWPTVVAKVSARALFYICIAIILIEPILRYLTASGHLPTGDVRGATYLIADNLALGALAVLFARSPYGSPRNAVRLGATLIVIAFGIFAIGYPFGILSRTNVVGSTFQTVPWNLFFTGLLLFTLGLRSPFFGGPWAAPLRFYGYISYGLYLIHQLIFIWYDQARSRISNIHLQNILQLSMVRFGVGITVATLIAWLSRRYYEEPFLRMGRKTRSAAPVPVTTSHQVSVL